MNDAAQLQKDEAKAAMRARAQEIADDLIGTCRSLDEFMTAEELEDVALDAEFHDLAFLCDCCGWWASTEELNNDARQEFDEMCDECAQSNET